MSTEFEEDATAVLPTPEVLHALASLASEQLALEDSISSTKERLSMLEDLRKGISERAIPELMTKIGMQKFTLSNGASVDVSPFYAGSISEANKAACFKWLIDNGHAGMIGTVIKFDLGHIEGVDLEEVSKQMNMVAMDNNVEARNIDIVQGIHHKTLGAFIKEQVQSGSGIPMELFKVFIGSKTKITTKEG